MATTVTPGPRDPQLLSPYAPATSRFAPSPERSRAGEYTVVYTDEGAQLEAVPPPGQIPAPAAPLPKAEKASAQDGGTDTEAAADEVSASAAPDPVRDLIMGTGTDPRLVFAPASAVPPATGRVEADDAAPDSASATIAPPTVTSLPVAARIVGSTPYGADTSGLGAVDAPVSTAPVSTAPTPTVSGEVILPTLTEDAELADIVDFAVRLNAARHPAISPALIRAVIHVESGGDHMAVSDKGAQGLMQLMPATAQRLGVRDPFLISENIRGGTLELSRLHAKYDNVGIALAAYNAGEGAVDRYKGIPPFDETRDYVLKVLSRQHVESLREVSQAEAAVETPTQTPEQARRTRLIESPMTVLDYATP